MNDNDNNPGPQPWNDPALEARIVAWVMGEASAFEVAELERLVVEHPELALFKRRIEAVHGLAARAVRPAPPKLQLSAERRRKLLDVIGAAPPAPEKKVVALPRPAWWAAPIWATAAAALIVGAFVATTYIMGTVRYKGAVSARLADLAVFESADGDFVSADAPLAMNEPLPAPGFDGGLARTRAEKEVATLPPNEAAYQVEYGRLPEQPSAGGMAGPAEPTFGVTVATAVPAEKPQVVIVPGSLVTTGLASPATPDSPLGLAGAHPSIDVPVVTTGPVSSLVTMAPAAGTEEEQLPQAPSQLALAGERAAGFAGEGDSLYLYRGVRIPTGHGSADDAAGDAAGEAPLLANKDIPAAAAPPVAREELARGLARGQAISANSLDSLAGGLARGDTDEKSKAVALLGDIPVDGVKFHDGDELKPSSPAASGEEFDGFVNYGNPIRRVPPGTPQSAAGNPGLLWSDDETAKALVDTTSQPSEPAADLAKDGQKPGVAPKREARQLLNEANGFYASGRYDLAFKRYEQVLQRDGDNVEARKGMGEVNQARAKYAETAYNESRSDMVRLADKAWEMPVRRFEAGASVIRERPSPDREAINRKLDDIIIPKVDFREVTVTEAMEFLKKRAAALDSAETDPARKGVNIVVKTDEQSPENNARITLSLTDIPLRNAIEYVAKAAALKTKVEPYAVAVVPVSESVEELVTREYKVPPDFLKSLASTAAGSPPAMTGGSGAREILESAGVQFPPGASAYYLTSSGKLIVRNTPSNLDLIETVMEAVPRATPTPSPTPKPAASREIPAAQQPFSTFSLHVSDVSFQLAKDALARGARPDPARIRPEEFYNAFDYNDPAPGTNEEVAGRIEQAGHPFLPQRDLVRIALKVAAAGRAAGQPLRLTILLDTSGSMEREDRAASVRRALAALASQLGPQDRVTLIGFARTPRLLADSVPGDQAAKLVEVAGRTPSEGGTNLEQALALASEMALKHQAAGAQNRIVLLTDGAANLGNADPGRLARQIVRTRQQGISFDACGVGANGLDDEMLEALTRQGDGRYYFLNQPEDADAGFARQLAGALRPAAENVKVQVVFNPLRVNAYRLIGFERHLLQKEDFRNDRVQAAELSAEEAGVALYQVQTIPHGEGDLGQVFVRFRDPATGRMVERSWTMPYEAKSVPFDRASPSLQLAATAAFLAEKLRGDEQADLAALAPVITRLRGQYRHQTRVGELVQMYERLRR